MVIVHVGGLAVHRPTVNTPSSEAPWASMDMNKSGLAIVAITNFCRLGIFILRLLSLHTERVRLPPLFDGNELARIAASLLHFWNFPCTELPVWHRAVKAELSRLLDGIS